MKFFSIVIAIFFAKAVRADICSESKCPNGRQPTTICFSDPATYSDFTTKAEAAANCGYFTEVVIATDTKKINETLDKLAKSCKSIDRMVLHGHGNDGFQYAGSLGSDSVQDLKNYGCLFNKNAEIHYTACNVGRGCLGDMFFYQTAKSLLHHGGTVTGATYYSTTIIPGIVPHFSVNGRSRKLVYSPAANPSDSWKQTGLAISNGGSINERCGDELKELLANYDVAKESSIKRQCGHVYNEVQNDELSNYRQIQTKLSDRSQPYLQSATSEIWRSLKESLNALKKQISRYESCVHFDSETSPGSGSGPSSSSIAK